MGRFSMFTAVAVLLCAAVATSEGALVNGATADLEMDVTITFSDGLTLTFVDGHGWNAGYAYAYTDVGGVVEEDDPGESGGGPSTSQSVSASTSNGQADGAVTTNTGGFDYAIDVDALVEDLDLNDYGFGKGYAYAWPDWLRRDATGTATVTIDYAFTLDTQDTVADAVAKVYMNAFFADWNSVNRLTAQGDWTVGYGDNPNTTIVEYSREIAAGTSMTISDSVSWNIDVTGATPDSWWSLWAQGEAVVELEPVPEPASLALLALGAMTLLRRGRGSGE